MHPDAIRRVPRLTLVLYETIDEALDIVDSASDDTVRLALREVLREALDLSRQLAELLWVDEEPLAELDPPPWMDPPPD